jgi:hypothetical protein
MRSSKPFSVKVLGAFDLVDRNGHSIRPAGRKDCALIAMLALTRNHRQTRTWLQDKLWGDRGPAQAAASLRQSLTSLRTIFNAEAEVLVADRTWIWLEQSYINFDHVVPGARGEVLRGLDLREEGFNDWLRQIRSEVEARDTRWGLVDAPGLPDRRWHLDLPSHPMADDGLAGICESLTESIIEALSVLGLNTVIGVQSDDARSPRATDMVMRMRALRLGSGGTLSISITDGFGSLRWQIRREIEPNRWYELRRIQSEIVQMLQDFAIRTEAKSLRGAQWSAHANCCQALMGMLVPGSMAPREIIRCSEGALAAEENGLYHALLGVGHLMLLNERKRHATLDSQQVMESFRTAMRLAPGNGLAFALAGHSYGFLLHDLERNLTLTREAVRLLPGNGACWTFYAVACVYCGKSTEAVKAARNAVWLCRGTVAQPFALAIEQFAYLMAGQPRKAIQSGEASLEHILFRPTIMDLMTAYALLGETAKGREKLNTLIAREPDLSLDMLRSGDYPIVNQAHRDLTVHAAMQLGLR